MNPEHRIKIETDTAYPLTAEGLIKILMEKNNVLDLTIGESNLICSFIGKEFTLLNIFTIFSDQEEEVEIDRSDEAYELANDK